MEERLYVAARHGNLNELTRLLDEDPIILDRSSVMGTYQETPLHIAAMLGHLDFAREILDTKPDLANERNLHGSTPLHLAAATNNVEMVTLLFNIDPEMCSARDQFGRNPVHIAAIRGRIEVLRMFLRVACDAARLLTSHDDNILHLCVKYNQLDALKVLVEEMGEFLSSVDHDGNTLLHLAVLHQQYEVINYLLHDAKIEVNAINSNNQTALDILHQKNTDVIGQTLLRAGAITSGKNIPLSSLPHPVEKPNSFKQFILQRQEAVMIAASLIATAAFQAAVNPPGGIWQDTVAENGTQVMTAHKAGFSIAAYRQSEVYSRFVVENTIGFVAAMFVFLLLLTGLPFKYKFFSRAFMVAIWVAIVAVASSFFSSLITVAPPVKAKKVRAIANAGLVISVILWVLIILWYVGVGPRLMRWIYKLFSKKRPEISTNPLRSATTSQTV